MSQQHQLWIDEVKAKLREKQWTQSDLAQVANVTPTAVSEMFKYGKGSNELKLKISKLLNITISWNK